MRKHYKKKYTTCRKDEERPTKGGVKQMQKKDKKDIKRLEESDVEDRTPM